MLLRIRKLCRLGKHSSRSCRPSISRWKTHIGRYSPSVVPLPPPLPLAVQEEFAVRGTATLQQRHEDAEFATPGFEISRSALHGGALSGQKSFNERCFFVGDEFAGRLVCFSCGSTDDYQTTAAQTSLYTFWFEHTTFVDSLINSSIAALDSRRIYTVRWVKCSTVNTTTGSLMPDGQPASQHQQVAVQQRTRLP